MKIQSFPSIGNEECQRVRLAEGGVAAVDRCGCGMFQVHVGAFTLRLAPEALSSLLETLGQAVALSMAARRLDASNEHLAFERDERWSKS